MARTLQKSQPDAPGRAESRPPPGARALVAGQGMGNRAVLCRTRTRLETARHVRVEWRQAGTTAAQPVLVHPNGTVQLNPSAAALLELCDGTRSFDEVVDWSFEASHPITINQAVLTRMLHGIRVGTDQASPVFTDKDVEFLAPALSSALTKATPEQVVVFQVFPQTGSIPEATGGTIYAKGPSIYLTLTQFRSKPIRTGFWSWASGKPSPRYRWS